MTIQLNNAIILSIRSLFSVALSFLLVRKQLDSFGVNNLATYSLILGYFYLFTSVSSGYRIAALKYITQSIKNDCRPQAERSIFVHIVSWIVIGLLALLILSIMLLCTNVIFDFKSTEGYYRVILLLCLCEFFKYLRTGTDIISVAFQKFWVFLSVSLLSTLSFLMILYLENMDFEDYFVPLLGVEICLFVFMLVYSKRLLAGLEVKNGQKMSIREYISFANASTLGGFSDTLFTRLRVIMYGWLLGSSVLASNYIGTDLSGKIGVIKNNFFKAFEPSLYGLSFVSDRKQAMYTYDLVARTNSFLLLIIVTPIILWLEYVLDIWLVDAPDEILILAPLLLLRNVFVQPMSLWRIALRVEGDVTRYEAQSFVFSIVCLSCAVVLTYMYRDMTIILYSLFLYDFGRHFWIEKVFIKRLLNVDLYQFYRGRLVVSYIVIVELFVVQYIDLNDIARFLVLCVTSYLLIYHLIGIKDLKHYVKEIKNSLRDKVRPLVKREF